MTDGPQFSSFDSDELAVVFRNIGEGFSAVLATSKALTSLADGSLAGRIEYARVHTREARGRDGLERVHPMTFIDEQPTGDWVQDPLSQVEWPVPREIPVDWVIDHARRASTGELRTIRFFMDWGHRWPFWENDADIDDPEPSDLGLSEELTAAIEKWSTTREAHLNHATGWDDPATGERWWHEGAELATALQREVYLFARVMSDFN